MGKVFFLVEDDLVHSCFTGDSCFFLASYRSDHETRTELLRQACRSGSDPTCRCMDQDGFPLHHTGHIRQQAMAQKGDDGACGCNGHVHLIRYRKHQNLADDDIFRIRAVIRETDDPLTDGYAPASFPEFFHDARSIKPRNEGKFVSLSSAARFDIGKIDARLHHPYEHFSRSRHRPVHLF